MLAPVVSGNFWLEFPGLSGPEEPVPRQARPRGGQPRHRPRRDRTRRNAAGLGQVDGNWINDDVQYGLVWPKWPYNLAKAKQLMAEAGYPNGFNVDWLTPAPPFYSRGERVISQLQAIGIRTQLQTLERAVYQKREQGGLKEWPGLNIIFTGARIGASWANWYESEFKCGGMLAADKFCVTDLDAKYDQYLNPTILPTARRWPRKSSARSSKTTILSRCSVMLS